MLKNIVKNNPDDRHDAYNEKPKLNGACFMAFPVSYSVPMLIPPHFHGELELVVFSGVGGSLRASNREERIEDERCYLIAPGTVHSYRIQPGSMASAWVVLVDLDACASALSLFSPGGSPSPHNDFCGEGLAITDSAELAGLLRELADRGPHPTAWHVTVTDALYGAELLMRMLRLAPKSPIADDAAKALNEKAKRVVEFVAVHFASPIGLDELAEYCAVSKYHLCRSFKDATGYTIGEYLARTRIREARRLLGAGSTVTEACYASGFRDLSHFIQTFRCMEGSTPKRWVKIAFPGRT